MHGNTVRSVITYGSYVFMGGGSTGGNYNFRKINTSNGNSATNKLIGGTDNQIQKLAIDSSGNVYLGDHAATVYKVDGSGNILLTITVAGTVYGLEVDSSGNIYVGRHYTAGNAFSKYNSSGTKVWDFNPDGKPCYGVALDSTGCVYVGDYAGRLHKLNSNGTKIWTYAVHTNNLWDIFIDSSKNIYTCSSDKTVKKLKNTWGKVKIAYYA
jgi:streptogramin lyase